jgi:class 3 adenylate cyclase
LVLLLLGDRSKSIGFQRKDSKETGSSNPLRSTNEALRTTGPLCEQPDGSLPDGERKTVTALFADIKGSMELMEDLDP